MGGLADALGSQIKPSPMAKSGDDSTDYSNKVTLDHNQIVDLLKKGKVVTADGTCVEGDFSNTDDKFHNAISAFKDAHTSPDDDDVGEQAAEPERVSDSDEDDKDNY